MLQWWGFYWFPYKAIPKPKRLKTGLFLPTHNVQTNTALTLPPRSKWHLAPSHLRRCVGPYTPQGWVWEHTVPCTSNRPIILPQGFIQLHTTPFSFGKIRLSHVAHDSCLCPTNLLEIRCWGLETAALELQPEDWSWNSYGDRQGDDMSISVSDLMKPEQIVFIPSSPSTKGVSPITTSELTFGPGCLENVRTNIMKTYFKALTNCTELLVRPWRTSSPLSTLIPTFCKESRYALTGF